MICFVENSVESFWRARRMRRVWRERIDVPAVPQVITMTFLPSLWTFWIASRTFGGIGYVFVWFDVVFLFTEIGEGEDAMLDFEDEIVMQTCFEAQSIWICKVCSLYVHVLALWVCRERDEDSLIWVRVEQGVSHECMACHVILLFHSSLHSFVFLHLLRSSWLSLPFWSSLSCNYSYPIIIPSTQAPTTPTLLPFFESGSSCSASSDTTSSPAMPSPCNSLA